MKKMRIGIASFSQSFPDFSIGLSFEALEQRQAGPDRPNPQSVRQFTCSESIN
jgi:hypothetical protein